MGTESKLCKRCNCEHDDPSQDKGNPNLCIAALAKRIYTLEENLNKIGAMAHQAALWTQKY